MADGYNNARAARIMEILTDFRNLQLWLNSLPDAPSAQEYYLEGYDLLRRCKTDAQTILQGNFAPVNGGATGNSEHEKQQLKAAGRYRIAVIGQGTMKLTVEDHSIIADAYVRRFKCQKLYLRANCGLRWMNRRSQILGGQPQNATHSAAIAQANTTLRNELLLITNEYVDQTLRQQDHAQGAAEGVPRYLNDDPSLAQILQMVG